VARPKGYANWSPRAETVEVIGLVQRVLNEYRDHLPLTVRQIFYRLVGQYGYEKTEQAYSRLAEYLVRARRAQMIPFHVIRDDGTLGGGGGGFSSPEQWIRSATSWAEGYERDRLGNQAVAVELWCEAAGMVPQLQRVAEQYSVPVYSTGGFSSVTVTHEIASRALREQRPTVFLHVGDYDPSGESIFEAMSDDARSFVRSALYSRTQNGDHLYLNRPVTDPTVPDLIPKRVALTEEQVEEYDLPTAPPKSTDSRSARWLGETCQAEAMPPDLLAEVVEEALRGELDWDAYEELLEEEREERERLVEAVSGLEL
jgi:hypothetical protein